MKVSKLFAAGLMMAAALFASDFQASAQFNLGKAISGGVKAAQALTLTDKQMAEYVKESVDWMDTHNEVAKADDPYDIRLRKLTANLKDVEGIPLNFKVYKVIDVNAFACPDGSVRVFSSLMDIMTDDELLGVIGHEIGHVAKHHSKNAYKNALLTSAAKDAIGSTGSLASALTDSQLGALSESLLNANYSRKQENEADEYGYDFLKKNGINPWALALSFEKLQSLEGDGEKLGTMQKMFSSHPDTKSRIEKAAKRATKDGFQRPANTSK